MPITDLPGFYPSIKDGGLGALPALNTSLFGMIGVASAGSMTTPKLCGDIQTILDTFESGTLVEQAIDAMVCGARQLVLLRAPASTADTVGTPTKTGSGKATATAAKQAGVTAVKCDRTHKFKITAGGSLSTAKYQYSNNNGITYSEEKSFVIITQGPPAISRINLEDGTYIEFTNDTNPEESFVLGDIWTLTNTEPKMNTTDLGDALDIICAYKDSDGIGLPLIYVAACGDESVWAILGSKASEIWTAEQRPIWFLINSPPPDYTDIDTWISNLVSSSSSYRDTHLGVNAFFGRLLDPRENLLIRPGGGTILGLIARAKLHWSIGWVQEMKIPNCVGIEPYNSDDDQMDLSRIAALNDARYITVRHWPGYGRVPTDDYLMAPATSDLFCIRNRRILDAAILGVQQANMPFVNSPGVAKEDMIAYKTALERPLIAMRDENYIVDFTLTLTPDQNIWANGIVHATIEIIPTPTKKKLVATFQLKTGTAASV